MRRNSDCGNRRTGLALEREVAATPRRSGLRPEPLCEKQAMSQCDGTWDWFDRYRFSGRLPVLRAGWVANRRGREMTVKAILSAKGSNVTTTEPTATLESGIGILADCKIGALVVLGADHQVIGLLSERDIVRALAERGADALTEPLARAMTREVSTCSQSETVDSIMDQMTAGKFRHVPVVEQERLVGIVSIGDVVKHTLRGMKREFEELHDYIQTA
jgi:CBS domain-containing protein